MERIRAEQYFKAAQEVAAQKGIEGKELESDEVVLEAARRKALAAEMDEIKPEEFEEIYGTDVVNKEASMRHQDLSMEIPEENKLGFILEAIVTEQIELNEWLGPGVTTQKTAAFDDYNNGTDFLAEFNEDGAMRHMGFAIDATFTKQVGPKLRRIQQELAQGEMGKLKYFRSADGSILGQKKFIPKVVLTVDRETIYELMRLWTKGEQKKLAESKVKDILIQEVVAQLRGQLQFLDALSDKNEKHLRAMGILQAQLTTMEALSTKKVEDNKLYKFLEALKSVVKEGIGQQQKGGRQETPSDSIARFIHTASRDELNRRYQELLVLRTAGDKSVKAELAAISVQLEQLNLVKKVEAMKDKLKTVHTRDELGQRYKFLLKEQKRGNKSKEIKAEIALIEGEFRRLKGLNKAKALIEERSAEAKNLAT